MQYYYKNLTFIYYFIVEEKKIIIRLKRVVCYSVLWLVRDVLRVRALRCRSTI